MLCLRWNLWLRPADALCVFSHQRVHKLASLQDARTLSPNKIKRLLYPFTDVDAYLDSSVDRSQFQLFHPSVEDIGSAEKLFCSSPSHKIEYYMSAERMDHAPTLRQPEGHTKKMNFYKVGKAFTLVDMPGYGHKAPQDFVEMVEPYLHDRKNLVRTFLLVDGSVGLQKIDRIALEMCEEMRCPYVMVVTKIDKCGRGPLMTNLLNFQDVLNTQTTSCYPQPFLVSSLHFSGIYLLRCFIAHVTGKIQLTDTSTDPDHLFA
ncbi:GTP-binding protein 8 isoform X2 [Nerophis ophidion]|uniref:GTP-binding protein 8 isoform X2 n=1 Tax=Nerophis ophidion TaxID=159077 RepID=UPI002ADF8AED|nr:GTP-binding protein 8 isoform X2 [Nerophis ophidion]